MKMTAKEFKNYVGHLRRMVPQYSNGRKVIVLGEDSKKGQEIIARASQCEGITLNQVYDHWSDDKEQAYNDAFEMYRNSRHGESFRICSHSTYGFTVSWLHDDGLTFLTFNTEYLIIFNE